MESRRKRRGYYEDTTTLERLQALHDKMDAVLAAAKLVPRVPVTTAR
jgi:hypothetical protein